jgi:hypothetical protein
LNWSGFVLLSEVVGLVLVLGEGSSADSDREVTRTQLTESGALLLANITAAALPPLPAAAAQQPLQRRRTHTAAQKFEPFFHRSNETAGRVVGERRTGKATATARWVPHATALRDHGPAVEVHVSVAPDAADFAPRDTGLTLCAAHLRQHHEEAVQVSELVRLDETGSHQRVIFTVATSHLQQLWPNANATLTASSVAATNADPAADDDSDGDDEVARAKSAHGSRGSDGKGTTVSMWVVEGQCVAEGEGQGGTWSLGAVDFGAAAAAAVAHAVSA